MDKLAAITGASSGIGQCYAERLAGAGWNLIIVARRLDRLEVLGRRLESDHGVSVEVIPADLSLQADVDRLCDRLANLPVTLLVNNAALGHYKPFEELPPGEATELVHLNVLAPILLTRAVLPGMRERAHGSIINVASLLAFSGTSDNPGLPKRAVYAASKSFLVTFTQILSSELRDTGV